MLPRFLILLTALLSVATIASAQDGGADRPTPTSADRPLQHSPSHMIAGEWQPVELEPVARPPWQELVEGGIPAEDACAEAPNLLLPGGGQTITNDFTESAEDPVMACIWAGASRPQGYRSAWYLFTPSQSGWVTVKTLGSSYDTVLAVYGGTCGALQQLSCSDDFNGFSSQVTLPVLSGQTYYVEVVDWHQAVSGDATLNVAAWLDISTNWQVMDTMAVPRSKHVAVTKADNIYVIGGQTVLDDNPVRTPHTDVYNTTTGTWTTLPAMPAGSDGLGYSNTDGALVNNKIYIPSGYTGTDGSYDGTHWVFDTIGHNWTFAPANNLWTAAGPAIYETTTPYGAGLDARYYLVGGLTGPFPIGSSNPNWQPRSETYIFRPDGPLFWTLAAPMPTARFSHTAGVVRVGGVDHLCVVGGIGKDTEGNPVVLAGGQCFSLASEQWSVTTGPLNYPRYNAGSAVDAAGNWYVFGGTDHLGNSVAVTELYRPATNTWSALDVRFDLGTGLQVEPSRPPRAWPRGGFVDSTLWVLGGHHNTAAGDNVINLVEMTFRRRFIPFVTRPNPTGEPDDTFATAHGLPLNVLAAGAFLSPDDFVDAYFFDVPTLRSVTIHLSNIPEGSNYDLSVYTGAKSLLGYSENVGNNNEAVTVNVGQGRYYVMVERVFPPLGADPDGQPYHIMAEG